MSPLGQDSENPQQRVIRSVHESFASQVTSSLSAFLQAEITVSLEAISFLSVTEFKQQLAAAALISFRLEPLNEWAILSLDTEAAFGLLELLLGGESGSGQAEPRSLTEIEWSLLEEVVRTLVAPLGEAWKDFHAVEFRVQALESDPGRLTLPDGGRRLTRLTFQVQFGAQSGRFEVALPQAFFDKAMPVQPATIEPPMADLQRNFELLQEARVELEVILDGPTMMFEELAGLTAGQVVRFDYPLQRPLRLEVNGAVSIPCQMVSIGKKRAIQIERGV